MKKIIIGIAGEMASGKGTVADYLARKYGAIYMRYSKVLRDILDRLHIPQDRTELNKVSVALRDAFGDELLSDVLKSDIEKSSEQFFVVEAIRRQSEVDALSNIEGVEFFLLYMQTDVRKRYDRLVERGENIGDAQKSFEEFEQDHALTTEKTIGPLKSQAHHVITNDGTLADLLAEVDGVYRDVTMK